MTLPTNDILILGLLQWCLHIKIMILITDTMKPIRPLFFLPKQGGLQEREPTAEVSYIYYILQAQGPMTGLGARGRGGECRSVA